MRGTTPIESLENTVFRLRKSLEPGGHLYQQVQEKQRDLKEAEDDVARAEETLEDWVSMVSLLKSFEPALDLRRERGEYAVDEKSLDLVQLSPQDVRKLLNTAISLQSATGSKVVMQGNSDSPTT